MGIHVFRECLVVFNPYFWPLLYGCLYVHLWVNLPRLSCHNLNTYVLPIWFSYNYLYCLDSNTSRWSAPLLWWCCYGRAFTSIPPPGQKGKHSIGMQQSIVQPFKNLYFQGQTEWSARNYLIFSYLIFSTIRG